MMRRPDALLRRLLRAQLRLKVMAGVVAVTLIALVAFDVAAVATMRRYLLGQTDSNLRAALALTVPRLARMLQGPAGGAVVGPGTGAGGQAEIAGPVKSPLEVTAFGGIDMAFLPTGGRPVPLQVTVPGNSPGIGLAFPPAAAGVVAVAGPHTVAGPAGDMPLRVQTEKVKGGSLVAGIGLDQVDRTISQVESIVTFGSIAVVLLIGVGVFFVLRRGLRPIEEMAAQADRITAGDLTERVTPHSTRSEVGRLGAALNGMLSRIEAGLHEREASQEQMRRFFADASHELRTPLASLRANAELYQQGALTSSAEVDEVVARIAVETRRMGRLVDDMLRLARLGQCPAQCRAPVDVTALVAACADRARIADPARTWEHRVAEGLRAIGDDELLRRAVGNLLTNVLVHTPPDTAATITASGDGEDITIEVRDDGPGVPPEQLPHIFERFYRAGTRLRPGSGLGLAIAAEIAAAHGGAATAAAADPHGLVVTLTLPAWQGRQDYPERAVASVRSV
jgi:two-component system OmpR family sensor kinase